MNDDLIPNEKELRALRLFVSTDDTRQHLATLWRYSTIGGETYVATDGHTEIVRRAGAHRMMSLHEITKLAPTGVTAKGDSYATDIVPPRWDTVLRRPIGGKLAPAYGIDPDYFARVGHVERAVGARKALDYIPPPSMSKKEIRKRQADLKIGTCAKWAIPSDPLEGWYFCLETTGALWEGIIMPRRV